MKKNCLQVTFFIFMLTLTLSGCGTVRYHSFHPGKVWKDSAGVHINAHGGGILYYNGTYYWFGEHKIAGEKGNKAYVGVSCYSSKDLYNWKDEGIVLSVAKDPGHPLTEGCIIERPKVIYNQKTRQFVMWFHHELKDKGYSTALSGIAVADAPTGPYRYIHSIRSNPGIWPMNVQECHKQPVRPEVQQAYYPGGSLPEHPDVLNILGKHFAEGQMERDMTLFVDDDGKAYHIYASEYNSTLQIAELTDDYLDHSGKYVRAFIARWMEAPTLFKYQNKYYFIGSGCTGWNPNSARNAVASSIWGPWMELGNPCEGPDAKLTFYSQSTYVLPVQGRKDAFIFMADRWNPKNAIDGRYVWLPIEFIKNNDGNILLNIKWRNEWDLSFYDNKK